jgi:acyl-[acyl-carrier-protein] desaturase
MSARNHTMPDDEPIKLAQHEVLRGVEKFVAQNLNFLSPIEQAWQPSDYLPDFTAENWHEQVQDFRAQSHHVTDDMLVVLVGDMVTEEALPSYSVSLNTIAQDEQGDQSTPWAKWLRGWTGEENRHGDLLNAYLRLTGRVDMRSVEKTVNHLIANGFNPRAYPDPYNGLVYTSFQERATKISHGNLGKKVAAQGDAKLAKICQRIAGDESRHETFYTRIMGHIFDADPDGAIIAFRRMMRGIISMPGKLMYDGKDPDLFDHFAIVAQRSGVYTVHDYAAILQHLIKTWNVAGRVVTGKAKISQDYLCQQAERYQTMAEEIGAALKKSPTIPFSWIYDRKV